MVSLIFGSSVTQVCVRIHLNSVCVIVDTRRKLFNLRMADNVSSAVADVTGIVRVMCIHNVTNSLQVCMVNVVY